MNITRYLCNRMAIALFLIAALTAQEAKERKLDKKDVPDAVTAAAAKAYPSAKIREWAQENEGGSMQYEASMVEGAKKRDVLFSTDGSVVAVEEVVPVTELPKAVRNSIKAKYPNAIIHSAEKITRKGEVQFELGLQTANKKEVVLTSEGRVVKEE